MPFIQSSLLPLVEPWARLACEIPSYPYERKNSPHNGIPLHLTVEDFKKDLVPLTWVSHDYDKAWDAEWIKTAEYPLLRYDDEKTGRVCRYFGASTLQHGSEVLSKAMWWAYLLLRRKGLTSNSVIKAERQAVFADPRSSYFNPVDKPHLDNRVLDFPRKQVYEMGFPHYGVSMIAYTKSESEGLKLWIAKRSQSKVSFPGLWDITVSGGIPTECNIQEGLEKEAEEEAGMDKELLKNAKSGGYSSYVSVDGTIEYEALFDLEVKEDYQPTPTDGEVEFFRLVKAEEVLSEIRSNPEAWSYWSTLLIIDFLIRHGIIHRENEPHLGKIVGRIHQDNRFVAQSVRLQAHREGMLVQRRKDEEEKQAKKFGARKEGQARTDAQVRAVIGLVADGEEEELMGQKVGIQNEARKENDVQSWAANEVEAHA